MLSPLAVPCTERAQALGRIHNQYAAVVLFLSRADGGAQLRVNAAAIIMTPAEVEVEEGEGGRRRGGGGKRHYGGTAGLCF